MNSGAKQISPEPYSPLWTPGKGERSLHEKKDEAEKEKKGREKGSLDFKGLSRVTLSHVNRGVIPEAGSMMGNDPAAYRLLVYGSPFLERM